MKTPISDYVKLSCWISIVLILWGALTEVIPSKPMTFFAFAFFCAVGILATAATWDVKK